MNWAHRTNLLIGWLILGGAGAWLWPGTSRLWINPTAAQISGGVVTVHRRFLLSEILGGYRPMVAYVETVNLLDGTLPPCVDRDVFRYQPGAAVASWDIGPWAARCMTGPFRWHAEWQPFALGVIPLRPVSLEVIVLDPTEGGGVGTRAITRE